MTMIGKKISNFNKNDIFLKISNQWFSVIIGKKFSKFESGINVCLFFTFFFFIIAKQLFSAILI